MTKWDLEITYTMPYSAAPRNLGLPLFAREEADSQEEAVQAFRKQWGLRPQDATIVAKPVAED